MVKRTLLVALVAMTGALIFGPPSDADGVLSPGQVPWCEEIELRSQTAATGSHFTMLLDEVAAGWNAGDARRAAACFTGDAVYSAAGDSAARNGRHALYDFFGGGAPRADVHDVAPPGLRSDGPAWVR